MKPVETVTLIRTELLRRGSGKDDSPVRIVTQWWTPGGELMFEQDSTDRIISFENIEAMKNDIKGQSDDLAEPMFSILVRHSIL